MSKFFGEQCRKRGKLSFKNEMRIFIRLAMNDPTTQTIGDVVSMLQRTYHMNVRLKGNTISYALPYRSLNGGRVSIPVIQIHLERQVII